jgi:TetR/AcrR family transcriptional regulator, transcriptional repressor for nem operon
MLQCNLTAVVFSARSVPSPRLCHGPEDLMPYPPNHRQETKARIVLSARRLFNRFGFDGVSIQQIMADAGLTHGGFYKHFASKSDLYAEVMECFFTDPKWNNSWEGVHVDIKAADAGAQIVRAYLSRQHFEEVENSCPMVALPSDVARSDKKAKQAFQTVFEAMVDLLQRSSAKNGHSGRTSALAIAALCVGGMVIARASEGHALGNELRRAAMDVALKLGGWDKDRNSKRARSKRRSSSIERTARG